MDEVRNEDLVEVVKELDDAASKEPRALARLLDKYSQLKGKLFAIRSEMGCTAEDTGQSKPIPSFLVVQTLNWVGSNVLMGSQMPFMQNRIDEKGRLVVDESNAEEVKQRAPDWTRQPAITAYLGHDRRRKFGTIVAVLSPPWVDDPKHQNWGADGRATVDAHFFQPMDSRGQIGLLDTEGLLIYALDGQHRVMGIRGIQELRDNGFLQMKNSDGKVRNVEPINKQDFLDQFRLDIAEFQALLDEQVALELIPAVIAGETRAQASRRVRSVFITINAYAQKAGKGETVLLDESDGFAIVARNAATLHPLFKGRVDWKRPTLPKQSVHYTTLDTIRSMARSYLSSVAPETKQWHPRFKDQVPVRPPEEEIERARDAFGLFLDRMRDLPVFRGLESGDAMDEVRQDRWHLLVRPVGQVVLAEAVGGLVLEGHKLVDTFAKLDKWDEKGGFRQHEPKSLWYGVTYNFARSKMNTRTNEDLAANLLRYMVRGADEEKRRELVESVVLSRVVGNPEKHQWIDFKGETKTYNPDDPSDGNLKHFPLPIA